MEGKSTVVAMARPPPVESFPSREENEFLVLIRPGMVYNFRGVANVKCIAGHVVISRAVLSEAKPTVAGLSISAPWRMSQPLNIVCAPKPSELTPYRLKHRIHEVSPAADVIMKTMEQLQAPAAVLLIHILPSTAASLARFICEDLFVAPYHGLVLPYALCTVYLPEVPPTLYTHTSRKAIEEASLKMISSLDGTGRVCCIVTGVKNSGKSTFLRFLINDLLSCDNDAQLYWMDTDVGQSEFTPAGCISFTLVDKPILDPPFFHQKSHFKDAMFYGDLSPKYDVDRFNRMFDALFERFVTSSTNRSILFINTMGWLEEEGLEILNHIVVHTAPTFVFHVSSDNSVKYRLPREVERTTKMLQVVWGSSASSSSSPPGEKPISAALHRDLSLLGYFSPLISDSCPTISAFSSAVPFRIPLDELTLCLPDKLSSIPDRCVLSSLNMQLLALCAFDKQDAKAVKRRRLLESDKLPYFFVSEEQHPPLRIVGFGILRGVDLEKRQLCLLTPVPLEQMKEVTCLARGANCMLPSFILQMQNHSAMPYVMQTSVTQRISVRPSQIYEEFRNISGFKRAHRKPNH